MILPMTVTRAAVSCITAIRTTRAAVARATITLAAAALMLPFAAAAQQQGQPPAKKDWDIRIGAGALYQPDYEGSDDYEIDPLPLLMINYRDMVFLRGTTLGANAFTWQGPRPSDKLQVGPLVRYQFGRDADDSDDLRGMDDIDAAVELGGFITYSIGPWSTGLTLFQDVSGAHEGFTAKLSAGHRHTFSPKLRLRSEIYSTWADESYTETYFGVTAAQSARSGMRRYQPEGGVKDIGLALDLDYSLTEHWTVTGRLGYKRLLGDAADSPLVEDRGSANQLSGGLSLSYRF
jgi:outer membrane protein